MTTFNVSDFLSTFANSKNFARPNLYQIEIFPPSGLQVDNETLRGICLNCKQTSFPGKTLETQQFIGGGYIARPTVYAASYAPITTTFYLSGDHKEKRLFDEWMKMTYNETTNTLNYYDDYIGTLIVSQLNRKMKVLKSYQLFEAYPISVNEINVESDTENAISEVNVAITYRNYRELK